MMLIGGQPTSGSGQNRLSEECPRRVHFTSMNRHRSPRLSRPVSAINGREQSQQNLRLFDHLIGAAE
jgi:hypothetical protein